MNRETILEAMNANSIPAGFSGLWYITKTDLEKLTPSTRNGKPVVLPPGKYTFLYRITDETLYYDPPGVVVMEDTPFELQTHIGFVMQAKGKVLVTGLGLGCVVRGLLRNPNVAHVTCIENSKDVLKLVAPHMLDLGDRLEIVEADALEWTTQNKDTFDCAWHDLWTDRANGEPHLDSWHMTLLFNCKKRIPRQGAWAFDRQMRRALVKHGIKWIG